MVVKEVNNENPGEHWEYIECNNSCVLDMGCGRWEHVEYRDQTWPTTPEFLIQKGADVVIAIDSDCKETQWLKANVCTRMNVKTICSEINSTSFIRELLSVYKPDVIKCDIEGGEVFLLDLSDSEFETVNFYAIETHSDYLFDRFFNRFCELGYNITAAINLVHASPCKVLFAKAGKNEE